MPIDAITRNPADPEPPVGRWTIRGAAGTAWALTSVAVASTSATAPPAIATAAEGSAVSARLIIEIALALGLLACIIGLLRQRRDQVRLAAVGADDGSAETGSVMHAEALRLRAAIATNEAGIGIWDLDLVTGEIIWDTAMYLLYGVDPLLTTPSIDGWAERLHPEDRSAAQAAFADAIERAAPLRSQFRIHRPDGSVRHVRAAARMIKSPDGTVTRAVGVNWDVTEAEVARERLVEAQRVARSGSWTTELDSERIEWSDQLFEIYGRDPALGPPTHAAHLDAHVPDDAARLKEAMDAARADGTPWTITARVIVDDEIRHVRTEGRARRDESGRVSALHGTATDVTEQVVREKALEETLLALDAARDCIFIYDGETYEFNYTNRGATEQVGWSRDELSRMTVTDFNPDFDAETFPALVAPLKERPNVAETMRTRLHRRDGVEVPVEVTHQFNPDLGEHGRFVAIVRDITDQIESERVLQETSRVLDEAGDCVFMFDADTLRFTYTNRGATDQVGWTGAELSSMTPLDIKPDYDESKFRDLIQPIIDEPGRRASLRTEHEHRDGHRVPVEISLQFIADVGRGGRFLALVRDITEQLEAERLLDEARITAELASRAKSEFLANMSHEIRTPMTAILGFADLLDGGDLDDSPDAVREAIRTIRGNADHLLVIINDILDMSKIEAGKMTIECIPVDVVDLVRETVPLLQPRADGKALDLRIDWATPVPTSIASDPTRLRQILLNLLGNAIKFTEVGTVTVRVSCSPEEELLRLDVIDSGIGMTPEQRSVIARFDAFQQADGSTSREFGGTGLGLRICSALADMLGGRIDIASNHGLGSTFSATVATGPLEGVAMVEPRASAPASSAASGPTEARTRSIGSDAASGPLAGRRVLLVEDGPDNQRLIGFHLRRAGADVAVAADGLEAIDAVTATPDFDLILMDMQMPRLDGYGATDRLRAANCTTPIIALTAHAMSGDRERCLSAGCDDYVIKPVDQAALIQCCADWCDRRSDRAAA